MDLPLCIKKIVMTQKIMQQTSDGKFFANEKDAAKHETDLEVNSKLFQFVNEIYCDDDDKALVYNFLVKHKCTVYTIVLPQSKLNRWDVPF